MTRVAIRTETALNCRLCGREGALLYESLRDRLHGVPGQWGFMGCPGCNLFWLHPRPAPEHIQNCYPNHYFTHQAGAVLTLGRSEWARKIRSAILSDFFSYKHLGASREWYRLLGRAMMLVPSLRRKLTMDLGALLVPYYPGGRLLDIGCGNGAYLAFMKALGWDVAGIESDVQAAAIAQSRFGIFVYMGTVENVPPDTDSFDVITMSHVLEHVSDPVRFLYFAARLLKPGGQLVIVTPNAKSLGRRLLQRDWYALDPPRHTTLFTPRSIKICLERTGAVSSLQVRTSTRLTRKIVRKWFLVRRTGRFRDEAVEGVLARQWQTRLLGRLFGFVEGLGNTFLQWGEEIECVATKDSE